MNQLIGFCLITVAINFGIWMLSTIEYSFKEAMKNAIITQIFFIMIIIGAYLIANGT